MSLVEPANKVDRAFYLRLPSLKSSVASKTGRESPRHITLGGEMASIDPGADTIQYVGDAALHASGMGLLTPLWNAFFPADEPVFSDAQMQQLTTLFEEMFAQQSYQEYLNQFEGLTRSLNGYITNTSQGTLPEIIVDTEQAASGLLDNGWSTARVYLSAALLHILALKASWEAAAEPDKPQAMEDIAQAALTTLSDLLVLEEAYCVAQGWIEYAAFKQATVAGHGSMPPNAITAFGADYCTQVQGLLNLLQIYNPSLQSQVTNPPYMMLFVPYDSTSTPITWSANSADNQAWICMMKCASLPAGVPANYFPLSDLAGTQYTGLPKEVAYVSGWAENIIRPESYHMIYNDRDSGNKNDYAAFSTIPSCIGVYSANNDRASVPDNNNMIGLLNSKYYTQVKLGDAAWDDAGTGAREDCIVYLHPQFGAFGVYNIFRSHSRPNPDTVNGLLISALSGHPSYVTPRV